MPRRVRLGSREVAFPSAALAELPDRSGLIDDHAALRACFSADGYVFLRGILPRDAVLAARSRVLEWVAGGLSVAEQRERARTDPVIRTVVEHPRLFAVSGALLDEAAMTFSFKWLRAVEEGVGSGAHLDAVYMGRGSRRVHTVWVPFGDVAVERGTLAVCEGSHRASSFQAIRETYGELDVDRDRISDSGWFTSEPLELDQGRWCTADFDAGDVIAFDLYTLHASTTNLMPELRVSCDVRFQPKGEPADERWVGDRPTGHTRFGKSSETSTTVAALRREWKV